MELSPKQKQILQLIGSWKGPGLLTLPTMADALNLASESTVRFHLEPLEEAGLVERVRLIAGARTPRIPQLTDAGRAAANFETIPMLGLVHGGDAGVQYDDPPEQLRFEDVFPLGYGEYFLQVRGNCMNGGPRPIKQGDLVLVRPTNRLKRPANGSIAHVEMEVTACENEILLREYSYDEETGLVALTHYHPRKKSQQFNDEEVEPRGEVVRLVGNLESKHK